MFYWLWHQNPDSSFLNVLRYPSFRILMAAFTAMAFSLALFPWFIRRLQVFKFGQEIRDDGPQTHLSKKGTPTMGGALILIAIACSVLAWADLSNRYVWMVLIVTLTYGAVGFYDDFKKIKFKDSKGLSGRWKLFWQFSVGAGVLAWLFYGTGFDTRLALPLVNVEKFAPQLPVWLYVAFAAVVVAGTSNAVNLTDGLDGLAIGPTMVSAFVFMALAYAAGTELKDFNIAAYLGIVHVEGAAELAVVCAGVIGAGVSFLWFNAYPAQVFMGDVGALALGGLLGMMAVITKNEVVSAIVHGVFLAEALSVMAQVGSFKLTGKRVLRMAPLHHHFELGGWAEPKVIVRFWIVSVMLAIAGLATLKLR
ncbi:MAG: phospho-N-acetylmuramoyl-pentapeptide-transferase [Deltaproteobacteria bacterium]|nr:phospho-N-acetylmuramoyl-pentapeptide-transferase [Deltaproteobacteria bacterium]